MLVLTYAILCFAGISFFIIRTKLAQVPSSPFKEISTSIRPETSNRDSLVQTSGEVNVIDPTRFLTPLIARYEDLPSILRFRGQVRGKQLHIRGCCGRFGSGHTAVRLACPLARHLRSAPEVAPSHSRRRPLHLQSRSMGDL